jgi:protein associated with RNAse G/E
VTILRVEKRKWDGRVSTVDHGRIVDAPRGAVAWIVPAGTTREKHGQVQVVDDDEVWVAVPGEWWVLCGRSAADGSIARYVLNAAAPFEPPGPEGISWIDLDLDYEVSGDNIALVDEAEFHAHAQTMDYPDDVVRGAWSGISNIAPRYTTGEWPFDGWMQRCLAESRP